MCGSGRGEEAIRMVSPDLVSKEGVRAPRCTDISNEPFPPEDVDDPVDDGERGGDEHDADQQSRKRKLDHTTSEEEDEMAGYEPSPNDAALEPIPEEGMSGSEGMETQEPHLKLLGCLKQVRGGHPMSRCQMSHILHDRVTLHCHMVPWEDISRDAAPPVTFHSSQAGLQPLRRTSKGLFIGASRSWMWVRHAFQEHP